MAASSGIYITWLMGAILLSLALMPVMKPPWAKIRISGFIDMFRRYWAHMFVVFSVYLWKDLLDQLDRILMANTQLDMTPYVYAIEGDIVLWTQNAFQNELLAWPLTHFYVMGFMTATFASFVYPIYFDDRHMADRVSLSMFWVYVLAVPFYLFFNVRVTGDYIPEMETIAYTLDPVVHNWFTRIDPFTNGMPSLHIGLPFAVWLTYLRWDEDNRWYRFRFALVIYIWLTGFTIIYLGIHWILDIIGGILVASIAVKITERTHETIWKFADERLFTRRFARLLEDPRGWIKKLLLSIKKVIKPFRKPSSKQTGAVIIAVLMGTGTVLLWDATHQDFPVQGVESPTTAAGTGGWLIGIEESPEGIIEVFAWNASTQVRSEVGGSPWSVAPKVIVTESNFVLFTDSRVDLFSLDSISQLITPKYSQYSAEEIVDVFITEDIGGEVLIGIVHTNEILFRSEEGFVTIEVPDGPYSICSSSGSFIATGRSSESGPIVEIFTIDSQFSLSINVNVIADEITDEHLEDTFEIPVNYTNSTIVELEFDSRWIAAVVDIGPLNRTVLIDTISGDQLILSDSVWPSSSVSLAHGKVAFLQIPRFDPTQDEEDQLTARDVFLHDIAENRTKQLTIDEDIDQSQPQVLNSAVAYLQEDEDGEVNIHLFALEETFEPYSSVVLQSAIVIIIPLMVLLAFQSALENKKSR
ncbi:MAG: phosphatase PAP2 family protein [Candidatus Thalassarchaeaceae archaeon]|nr:phosphatase PAP2 family protein [Candidatus Thalassarchaeaceae archaeon]MDP6318198.1 phosphatase PAP2 family protein [Candidatus Thalassarchaeaceae archaeon]DAC35746.1 MAG TPA: inositol phosphorylceramide synthase [Candidatus Poseidoniales archaeon]HIH79982.1 inositol phosphorylceramide synthase [Candidatus Thalassarchaeaceae archaeon]HJM29939.1 phosphatase PAP2 family protein [Candidatus Thalassarchaeaceae archaeon]|tara:strand:- start:1547 stop:3637 length:2091 start_codon:yes stop_codon:yes gene_type:complete